MKKKRVDKYELLLYFFIFIVMIFNIALFLFRGQLMDAVDTAFGGAIDFNTQELISENKMIVDENFIDTSILTDPRVVNLKKNTVLQKNLISENRNPFGDPGI